MSSDSWGLGCPGSGNILFQRRNSSIFRTNGIPKRIIPSYSHSHKTDLSITHFSLFSTFLSVVLFFPPTLKPRCQGRVMSFVGGGGNIAITTALPPSFCVLYCKHLIVYGIHIFYFLCLPEALFFMLALFPLSADCSVVMCGALPGTLVA